MHKNLNWVRGRRKKEGFWYDKVASVYMCITSTQANELYFPFMSYLSIADDARFPISL